MSYCMGGVDWVQCLSSRVVFSTPEEIISYHQEGRRGQFCHFLLQKIDLPLSNIIPTLHFSNSAWNFFTEFFHRKDSLVYTYIKIIITRIFTTPPLLLLIKTQKLKTSPKSRKLTGYAMRFIKIDRISSQQLQIISSLFKLLCPFFIYQSS